MSGNFDVILISERRYAMTRLLIVDDDIHLRKLVQTYAETSGYTCDEASSGDAALKKLLSSSCDLIILDVMMPGEDGFKILEKIRETKDIPVIMLTARNEEYDRLLGFRLGADDYVPKPFSPRELMARVGAVLKRVNRKKGDAFSFGSLTITPSARTAVLEGKRLTLSPKEFDLLLALAENEHIVMSREKLLQNVWGYSYYGDARTVDTHITSLREHLGSYRKYIETVWGVGYKFEYTEE
jgi:two-component system response regulator ResD